jgi:predicted esterase
VAVKPPGIVRHALLGSTLALLAGVSCGSGCGTRGGGKPLVPALASATASSASASASTAPASVEASAPGDPDANVKIAVIDPKEGVGVAPGPQGHLGAWLALGPFLLDEKERALPDVDGWAPKSSAGATRLDDHALAPAFGEKIAANADRGARDPSPDGGKTPGKWRGFRSELAAWSVVSSGDGAIDLDRAMPTNGKSAVAYLGGVLRLPVAQKLILLLGVDDGVEVIVDGKVAFTRDAARPFRDDDDFVPLDLAAGDHTVLFKLRQRDGAWLFRARVVDVALRPPVGVRLLLPKAPEQTAKELAAAMSWVRVIREPIATGYRLGTLVKYPEGAPLHVPIEVTASLVEPADKGQPESTLIAPKKLGALPIAARATGEVPGTLAETDVAAQEQGEKDLVLRIEVGGRRVDGLFHPRAKLRSAIARARALLAKWGKDGRPSALADDVEATLAYLSDRLAGFVTRGDADVSSQLADAAELDAITALAEQGKDPLAERAGVSRYAHVAKADGKPQPIVVQVPKSAVPAPGAKSTKKVPLYVGLHGMDGGPMAMTRVFFGGDVFNTSHLVLDRGLGAAKVPESFDGFVLAPHAHGNAMYRQLGEEEVLDAIAWAEARWPAIDPDRVYLTGYSMGGIGAGALPLHHPDLFAASQPLCGYHSYAIRRDIQGRPVRPWEKFLIEERSNVQWAENGARLPLYVIHGKMDLPEENSGVLIKAYEKLGFSIKHEHPERGHDVWALAYDKLSQVKWFGARKRDPHPKKIRFRTTRPRFGDDAWVHVEQLSSSSGWGVIDATATGKHAITAKTKGIDAVRFDRDAALFDGEVTVAIDDAKLTFAAGAPLLAHREASGWKAGAWSETTALRKQGRLTGPIRDVWHEPLIFVYGTQDPSQTTANLEVAQAFAKIRWGTDVAYPIVKDSEIDPAAAPTKSLVLIGNAKSNRVLAAIEKDLPLQVKDDGIHFGGRTFTGSQLGAAFVYPHPKAHDRYVLVIEGADALGTFRAISLPELLPDFVVWDASLAPARGQQLLSFGSALAAGFFDQAWLPPADLDDPLATKPKSGPKNERDGTAYLP